jgi:hypothetical protein
VSILRVPIRCRSEAANGASPAIEIQRGEKRCVSW